MGVEKKRALIAMSGGVDSSVSAYLMKEKGYECAGVTMRLYHNEEVGACRFRTCCSEKDVADASEVAERLGMPYEVVDYVGDFGEKIIDKFIRTYECGGTPNPCIDCNRYMKFDKLLAMARKQGRDFVVTGHYARIAYDEEEGRWLLKTGLDPEKDQSYVLYSLTQEQLAHTRFPLGELSKEEVRRIAAEQGFINASKPDSQDICFVPDGDYASFIRRYTGRDYPAGDFVDEEGKVLGRHKGIIHYTIGQRKGLGIAAEEPYYVTEIRPESGQVALSHGEGLFKDRLLAHDINLISLPRIQGDMAITAKIRYRQKATPGIVRQLNEDTLEVVFDTPQRAITRGQALVLYDGDKVVGGGTIA